MCLNFNSAFILLPRLRYFLTYLRSNRVFASLLPLDDSVWIHKVVGVIIFLLSLVHTIAHLVNIAYSRKYHTLSNVNFHNLKYYQKYIFTSCRDPQRKTTLKLRGQK